MAGSWTVLEERSPRLAVRRHSGCREQLDNTHKPNTSVFVVFARSEQNTVDGEARMKDQIRLESEAVLAKMLGKERVVAHP